MNKYHLYILFGVIVGGAVVSFLLFGQNATPAQTVSDEELAGVEVTFYRSPTCGCCAGHAAALEEAGAIVAMQDIDEVTLQNIKQKHDIPFNKQSCHTAVIEDYVVEGHVPVEALVQLLNEKPDIRGITLPGMPIGTPGMPGQQTEPYVVETLGGDTYWRKDPS